MPPSGAFRVLRNPDDIEQQSTDIILVPGIGTIPPEQWPFLDEEWLTCLPGSGARLRVLAFDYVWPSTTAKSTGETILTLGFGLFQALNDLQDECGSDKPLVIACHSLGGNIVKQALCIADSRYPQHTAIINAVAGIIFFSSPHRYADKSVTSTRFREVLELFGGKNFKTSYGHTEQEAGGLLHNLADRFQGLQLRTPILSTYELQESKITASTMSLRPRHRQLVDRGACTIHAPMETIVALNLNHHDACLFTRSVGGEGLSQTNDFIRDTLQDAARLVAVRCSDLYQYANSSTYSPTLSELQLDLQQLELADVPSNQATENPSTKETEVTSRSGFEIINPVSPGPDVEDRRMVHLPCHLLSEFSANDDFCGREDVLDQLAAELLPAKTAVTASSTPLRQFAICGIGGLGKTEIAREFCRRHKSLFDAVFWVVADEVAKLDQHFQEISLALGLEEESECKSQIVSRGIVKGWLSNPRKQLMSSGNSTQSNEVGPEATWLLVFDNADDPMLLADYWPSGSGSILVTSRDPLAKTMFTRRASGLDLSPLSAGDSLALLTHLILSSTEYEDVAAKKISEALGGIPLAISQMAGIIRRQDLTLSEFLELYTDHEEQSNLYETKFDTNLVTYRHSLSTVWALEKLKPQTRALLELTCFLDPDVISEDLLKGAVKIILSDGKQPRKSSYIEARAELLQSSLVQRDKQKQHLSIHRVVQDVIFATMDATRRREVFDQWTRVLWSEWPSAMPKPSKTPELPQPKSAGGRLHVGRWPACAAAYPHVLRMHMLWPTIEGLADAMSLLFAKLLTEAAWYQKERGRTKEFDGFFDSAQNICESSTHPDRDSLLADIHFCLGSIAMDTSDFNASRVHKEQSLDLILKICKELGIADERLYLAYAEMGISRIQDMRYEEGEASLKEALRIRKALGNYVPRSGEANLSYGLMAQGKLDECDKLLLDSLEARERALGVNDTESVRTGLIFYALGNLRGLQHRWDESFEYHQRAWRHMLATVGEKDFYTAIVINKTAEHLDRAGRHEEAISMLNKALDIWSVDQNAHKTEIARTTFFKAKIFEATGKAQKATIALRVAGRLRKEITREDRDPKGLKMQDFDQLVAFWAR